MPARNPYRLSSRIAVAAGLTGCLIFSGFTDHANAAAPPRSPDAIYARTCGYCHGHNVGPIILGRHLSADLVATLVRSGRGAMPAFKPTEISPAELDALAQWVSTAQTNTKEHGQ